MTPTPTRIAAACASLLAAANAHCLNTDIDWLQVSGFISQGAIHTSDNNWFGNTDDAVGFDFREIGAAFVITPAPALRFSAQLLSRKAGENDDGSIKVDHAVASYDFINTVDWTVSIRAGRMKSALGLYNETRDVPFTRPGIFLPASVYLERVRNSFFFQNGVMLRTEWRHQLNSLSWHAGFHRPKVDDDELADISRLAGDTSPDAEGRDSWSTGLVYDINAGTARLGAYYEEKKINIAGNLGAAEFGLDDLQGDVLIRDRKTVLSVEYNLDKFNFVAERAVARVSADVSMHNPDYAVLEALSSIHLVSPSYYYQVIYRASEQWDVFVRYDRFILDEDDKDGDEVSKRFGFNFRGLPPYAFYAKSYSVGAGWHPAADWMLRVEWLNNEGTGWLNVNDNDNETPVKYWDMIAMQLSYRF